MQTLNGLVDTGEGEGGMNLRDVDIPMTVCKIDSQWEASVRLRELSSVVCDDLEGWIGGWEGVKREGTYVYIHFIIDRN